MQQSTWFTPEGLEDLLPPQAHKLEYYRRKLIDGFHLSGYELVLPPIAEFTDSLLTGTARGLAVDTCRFTDQESGRMMGVRADMTPQAARIVSNRLKAEGQITRLCYVGEVLKTRNNKAKGSRSPIQVGAELFGDKGVQSDIEVIELMLNSLSSIELSELILSLGHVGVVNELITLAGLDEKTQADLLDILKRKAVPEYQSWLQTVSLSAPLQAAFEGLIKLAGDADSVLSEARTLFADLKSDELNAALARLAELVAHLNATQSVQIHLDLADIRGYLYHTGVIFGCYSGGRHLQLIAKGGRYDGIGKEFGLALPATGFSLDLRTALDMLDEVEETARGRIYAPVVADAALKQKVADLKAEGYQVMHYYRPDQIPAGSRKLVEEAGQWQVIG